MRHRTELRLAGRFAPILLLVWMLPGCSGTYVLEDPGHLALVRGEDEPVVMFVNNLRFERPPAWLESDVEGDPELLYIRVGDDRSRLDILSFQPDEVLTREEEGQTFTVYRYRTEETDVTYVRGDFISVPYVDVLLRGGRVHAIKVKMAYI